MIEINLLPEELRKKEKIKLDLPEVLVFKILSVILIVVISAQILLSTFAVYQKIEFMRTKKAAETLISEDHEIAARKAQTLAMSNHLKEIRAMTERKFLWAVLLNALSDSMTKGVWLRSLSVATLVADEPVSKKKEKIQKRRILNLEGSVIGSGQETAIIGKFIQQLKESPRFGEWFEDIKLSTINQKKIKDFDVYDFVLIGIFKREKR